MYSPSRAHSPVHRLHSRNAPKSYRRFFSLGLGSSRSFRLHPIFLIPIFLLGTLFSPFTSTTGTNGGTGSGRREVLEPIYKREDYLYTPEQSFLKPDAPPLDLLQDDLSLGPGGGGQGRTRGDIGGKVLARTGHGEGEDESEWWDPTTSTSSTNDNQDSDSQGIYYERQGYLYFQSSPRTIPSLQQNPKFPLLPKLRPPPPPPPVAKRPAAQPLSDQSVLPPPPPGWLTPGDLFKSPLERFSPPQLRDPLNAPLPPAPPPLNQLRPPNAARPQLALKNGKGFVPSKPEELVLAEKEYKKELEKKKKEEIDKGFRGLVWAQVEPEKKVLGIDDDEDEEEEKENEEEDEEELSDLEILKAVRELSVEEKKLLSKEEREVIRQLELKYPLPDNEKPPTRVQDLMKQPQQPQVGGGGGGQRRGNFRDRAGAAAKEKGKFNPLVGGGQPGRERVVAGRAQQQQQQQAQGRRRGGGGGGGLRKRSLPIVEDNSNEHDSDDENESSRFVLESIDESQPQPQEEEQESTDQHSKRSLTDSSSSSSSPPPSLPHPITLLISQAEERWESMLRRQSQTLEQAVEEYKRRYGYPPPVGFDSWWRYAMENRIILVDEYDQIFKDIEPFRSLSPKEFKKRSKSLQTDESLPWFKHSFGIGIKSGQIKQYTYQAGKGDKNNNNRERVEDLMDLLAEFSEMIPEDVELRFMNGDEPGVVISGEAKQRHLEYASQGKFLSSQEAQEILESSGLTPWDSLCLPNSTSRRKSQALQTDEPPSTSNTLRSFINLDHDKAIDLCLHPELKNLNGFTSWSGPRPYLLYPVFSSTKTSLHSDLLIPSISNDFYTPVGKDPSWEGKKHDKVYWRGENRGSWYSKGSGWRNNQRARLVTLANTQDETSTSTIHFTTTTEEQGGGEEEESIVRTSTPIPLTSLTSYYLDIAFSGQPLQCSNSKLDQTCKDLSRDPQLRWDNPPHLQGKRGVTLLSPEEEENQYKYVLDVDANYISGKFKRLMSSRSLVFKSTIFPEWWSKRIMPWYHYVPIKSDYSDLLDISSYFIGQPDDQKSGNHDLLAKKLALRGQKWSQEHWREVDMAAYMFRLYLEYARLLHRDENDPTSMDYSG
ncbi:hypothetical protein JCM5350_006223 [Sporobolomyces pararoseus]